MVQAVQEANGATPVIRLQPGTTPDTTAPTSDVIRAAHTPGAAASSDRPPGVNEPSNEHLLALETLSRHRETLDTAQETWLSSGPDQSISEDDLQAFVDDPVKFGATPQETGAVQYLLREARTMPEGLAGTGRREISFAQIDRQLADARDYAGAGSFASSSPAGLRQGSGSSPQEAAWRTAANYGLGLPGREIEGHTRDAAWLRQYFRALGGEASSQELYRCLSQDGPARTEARQAIQTLQAAGGLQAADLDHARFRTGSGGPQFSLRTLLEADTVQQQIEARRATLAAQGQNPTNTTTYDAYDALLTVADDRNKSAILQMAKRYDIDPALLGGVVASEMDLDTAWWTPTADAVKRRLPIPDFGTPQGSGVARAHTPTVEWAVNYLQGHHLPGAEDAKKFWAANGSNGDRADTASSIEGGAIVLAALSDLKRRGAGGASASNQRFSAEDMAVIWGGYRTGVAGQTEADPSRPGVNRMPLNDNGEGGFASVEDFGRNRANVASRPGAPSIGNNAYQSQPYFEMFKRTLTSPEPSPALASGTGTRPASSGGSASVSGTPEVRNASSGTATASRPPSWMQIARSQLGVRENTAPGASNPTVETYLDSVASTRHLGDDTPWCGAFVNWTMKRAGYPGLPDGASADAWSRAKGWGQRVDPGQARYGDVVVTHTLVRDPGSGRVDVQEHVGFLVERRGSRYTLLAGNTSNRVGYASYGAGQVVSVVRPTSRDTSSTLI